MKRLTAWLIAMMIVWSAAVAQAGDIKVNAIITSGSGEDPVTIFPPSTPKLFATFKTKGAQKGDKIRGVWIAEDVGSTAPANTKIDEKTVTLDGDTNNGAFWLSQPTKGWPAGKYRVEIYANDELATKVTFTIEAMEKGEKREAAEKAEREAAVDVPDLNGKWIGYYEDGSKSEYVWSIRQTGSTLVISNVGGQTAKSKGRIEGNKVFAEDFATKNGKLSADGTKISWTDGVVWKKQ
jgi:hypothetical protein